MSDYFKRLLIFNDWANREVLRAIGPAGEPEGAVRLLAHLVAAEWLWLRRLGREGRTLPVWPELTAAEIARELTPLRHEWTRFLDAGDARLLETISYTNSKGEPWASAVPDVLTHVVSHGAHHRGQIVALFRPAGMTPPYVDFIEASRRGYLDAPTVRAV